MGRGAVWRQGVAWVAGDDSTGSRKGGGQGLASLERILWDGEYISRQGCPVSGVHRSVKRGESGSGSATRVGSVSRRRLDLGGTHDRTGTGLARSLPVRPPGVLRCHSHPISPASPPGDQGPRQSVTAAASRRHTVAKAHAGSAAELFVSIPRRIEASLILLGNQCRKLAPSRSPTARWGGPASR